jgi:hypothetical protein
MDAIARTLGEKAGKTLGQPFVIENKPGAGGNIGADYVAKQPGDGYTLMITAIGMATNKRLYGKLSYDPVKDFAPVSLLAVVPNVLVANATQPDVNRQDVIAAARKAPGKLTYASARQAPPSTWRAKCSRRWRRWTCCMCPTRERPGRVRPAGRPGQLHVRQHHLGARTSSRASCAPWA